jgi:hypothetical protein
MAMTDSGRARTPLQTAALVTGVLFLVVGVAGFIPGITTDYDTLQFLGPDSEAMLLGIFQVSVLHNLVHLAFGVWGVAASRVFSSSRVFLIGGGVAYGVLWVYGLVVGHDSEANFVPLNDADDWLHLGLAVAMIGAGVVLGTRDRADTARIRR